MKRHIWANPGKEWEGFRFRAYWLDPEKVLSLPLTLERSVDGKEDNVATTVEELYRKLADGRVESDHRPADLKIKTKTQELCVRGLWFNLEIMHTLLTLLNDGVDPFAAQWFWYDHNRALKDPHEVYEFFVVANGKIVRESVSFSDYPGSGFDPSVFVKDDSEPSWLNEKAERYAVDLFWYHKFLQETTRGQLMALRHDGPALLKFLNRALYHIATPASRPDIALAALLYNVVGYIYRMRWLIILVGLAVLLAMLGRR
jgi:hypothetical protein